MPCSSRSWPPRPRCVPPATWRAIDHTNSTQLSFAEVAGTCGVNGVAIVTYLYNLGATTQTPTNEPFYFIVG